MPMSLGWKNGVEFTRKSADYEANGFGNNTKYKITLSHTKRWRRWANSNPFESKMKPKHFFPIAWGFYLRNWNVGMKMTAVPPQDGQSFQQMSLSVYRDKRRAATATAKSLDWKLRDIVEYLRLNTKTNIFWLKDEVLHSVKQRFHGGWEWLQRKQW